MALTFRSGKLQPLHSAAGKLSHTEGRLCLCPKEPALGWLLRA